MPTAARCSPGGFFRTTDGIHSEVLFVSTRTCVRDDTHMRDGVVLDVGSQQLVQSLNVFGAGAGSVLDRHEAPLHAAVSRNVYTSVWSLV